MIISNTISHHEKFIVDLPLTMNIDLAIIIDKITIIINNIAVITSLPSPTISDPVSSP